MTVFFFIETKTFDLKVSLPSFWIFMTKTFDSWRFKSRFRTPWFDSVSNYVICWMKPNVTKRIQHYPTSKSREKKGWKLDEMFDSDQTLIQHFFPSSNIIFSSFSIFALEQTIPTFHPTKRKWHVGWNVGIVYLGLNNKPTCVLITTRIHNNQTF